MTMKRRGFKVFSVGALLAMILAGAGCVSKELEPEHKPKLSVAQHSDGSITMYLDTQVDYIYTILYLSPTEKTWQVMKGCEAIEGTGGVVEFRKTFSSRQQIPPFTVDFVKKK